MNIVNALWYVKNEDLRRKLQVRTVNEEIKKVARNHQERFNKYPYVEVH